MTLREVVYLKVQQSWALHHLPHPTFPFPSGTYHLLKCRQEYLVLLNSRDAALLQSERLLQACGKQVYQHHVFNSICSIVSLCHTLAILEVFQTFSLLLYLLKWSMISDLLKIFFFCLLKTFYCDQRFLMLTVAERLQLTEDSDDG